jgi:hypothetical protein
MPMRGVYLQEIHAYDRRLSICMPGRDACLGEIYACERRTPVRDARLSQMHACGRHTPVRDACL